MTTSKCPHCGSEAKIGVEYAWNHPHHYDGISEWLCELCRTRWGRWSGRVLKDGECERRFGMEVTDDRVSGP